MARHEHFTYASVSREVWPFSGGGGIGRAVSTTAGLLAKHAHVTIVTTELHREEYERMRAAGDARLPDGVEYAFAEEPTQVEAGSFGSLYHAWSAKAYERVRDLYGGEAPEIIEFPDYTGEGFVTIEARRSGDPALRSSQLVVSVHTTEEVVRVLNRDVGSEDKAIVVHALERGSLRFAQRLLAPEGVLPAYERFYGLHDLAPASLDHRHFAIEHPPQASERPPPMDRVRLLYLGRLERRKGVQNLVRAVTALGRDDWELTLLGRDTHTAPHRASMRVYLEAIAAGDPRIVFHDEVPHDAIHRLIREHHVVVMPSLWECWGFVAREALMHNRPVLATPTGGLAPIVEPGRSGWLTRDTSVQALHEALRAVLDGRGEIEQLIAASEPLNVLRESIDEERTLAPYLELAGMARRAVSTPEAGRPEPLVSALVALGAGHGPPGITLRSLATQTHPRIETLVLCDGPRRVAAVEATLAEHVDVQVLVQDERGRGSAHNLGIARSRGRYVLPLDAGTRLEPRFVERAVEALESDGEAAYATAWPIGRRPAPLGNFPPLVRERELGGTPMLLRREVFDRGMSYSEELVAGHDWLLQRELREAGMFGVVVPDDLVEPDPVCGRALDELQRQDVDAELRYRSIEWEREDSRAAPVAARSGGDSITARPGRAARFSPHTSVIMPAYNAEATILEAVETALGQTMGDLELIVVDDGSDVPVAELLGGFHDARLRIVRHERNRGLSRARNTGLAAAQAPLISQLDADDLWEYDYLESVLPCFEDPPIGLAYTNATLLGHPEGYDTYIPDPSVHPMDRFPKLAEQDPVPNLTATMRTEAVRAVGGWATWLWGAQDYYLECNLVAAGWRFAYVDRKLARYRWPDPGRGMSYERRKIELAELKMWIAFMLRHPLTPGPRRQVRTRARREIARLASSNRG